MKCENIDNIVVLALVLTVIGDSLGLLAELMNQRCEKKAERQQQEKETRINEELDALRKRIALLENKQVQFNRRL
ncbi:hypothetical protein SDC9_04025 [bioreactor metagenome]|uniref:Uncharacterized protein n=1 Tax=bioreactor metagenome TaxID=1076179 RepID=A0A644SXR8_9ZZZZ|nr:hypothetical protein [Negativicutes bacterium]